jgi:hypothetical protein
VEQKVGKMERAATPEVEVKGGDGTGVERKEKKESCCVVL